MDDVKETATVMSNGGNQIEPDGGMQGEPVPSSEQKPVEPTGQLPDDSSTRTKVEFDKLLSRNRAMAQELEQYKSTKGEGGNVFESIFGQTRQQPTTPVPQVQRTEQEFVDSEGYVNPEVLKKSLYEANSRAERAEQLARQTNDTLRLQEERRQADEAHAKFPWLDPKNRADGTFDQQAFDFVKAKAFANMMEGRDQRLVDIAEEVAKFRTPAKQSDELKEQAVAEYKEKQSARAQASSVQSGKGQPRDDATKIDDLRRRTSMGDDSALDERLRNI